MLRILGVAGQVYSARVEPAAERRRKSDFSTKHRNGKTDRVEEQCIRSMIKAILILDARVVGKPAARNFVHFPIFQTGNGRAMPRCAAVPRRHMK